MVFILRGDLLYVLPCVILFLCFSVPLVLRLPRFGKRELILVLLVRLFDLCLFGFVGFLLLLVSGKGCGLWLWHSLDFSLTLFFFFYKLSLLQWRLMMQIFFKVHISATFVLDSQWCKVFFHAYNDAQADLSLCWAKMTTCTFSDVAAYMVTLSALYQLRT